MPSQESMDIFVPDAQPMQLDLGSSHGEPERVAANPAPVQSAPYLARAGVTLAQALLCIMAVTGFAILVAIVYSEFGPLNEEITGYQRISESAAKQYLAASSPESLQVANDFARRASEAKKEMRVHWMSVLQMLLLNVFLPVLTSILGYVFGTSRAQD